MLHSVSLKPFNVQNILEKVDLLQPILIRSGLISLFLFACTCVFAKHVLQRIVNTSTLFSPTKFNKEVISTPGEQVGNVTLQSNIRATQHVARSI